MLGPAGELSRYARGRKRQRPTSGEGTGEAGWLTRRAAATRPQVVGQPSPHLENCTGKKREQARDAGGSGSDRERAHEARIRKGIAP